MTDLAIIEALSPLHWLSRIPAWYRTRRQRRIDRAAYRNMLRLDDAMLKDIGVTRADVLWASELPLSENAALELQRIARRGRG